MSKQIDALKLALEALESAEPKYTKQRADQKTLGGSLDYWKLAQHQRMKAITAIKESLAQPEQEPVAHFGSAYVNENGVHVTTVLGPVAIPQDAKLYTTPPQRKPWVSLSDEDIERIAKKARSKDHAITLAQREIKEKNT